MTPSGKLQLRMPVDLHGHLIAQAKANGVSLNTYMIALLAGRSKFNPKDK
jgi:predicted HicB family RNase H-like nuclease